VKYLLMGGIALGGLGRARISRHIDVWVMPEESELALLALERRGFTAERTDPHGLYKAFKNDVLVNVVFKSKGEIYLDAEMYSRMTLAEFRGQRLRLVSPEDLVIIQAVAHSEITPHAWHEALALLSSSAFDWGYFLKRARRAPHRILSLLLYAQSNDIWVPNQVVQELYADVFGLSESSMGDAHLDHLRERTKFNLGDREKKQDHFKINTPGLRKVPEQMSHQKWDPHYDVAHLQERFARDPRLHELDLQVEVRGNQVVLKGEVSERDRRDVVEEMTREIFPGVPIENQIQMTHFEGPISTEEIL